MRRVKFSVEKLYVCAKLVPVEVPFGKFSLYIRLASELARKPSVVSRES